MYCIIQEIIISIIVVVVQIYWLGTHINNIHNFSHWMTSHDACGKRMFCGQNLLIVKMSSFLEVVHFLSAAPS